VKRAGATKVRADMENLTHSTGRKKKKKLTSILFHSFGNNAYDLTEGQ